MGGFAYREDMDQVRQRLTHWWNGGDIGRPVLLLTVRRDRPHEKISAKPEPDGWVTHYGTGSFEYRVNMAARACIHTDYLCEAVPTVAPDLGPNCLALYLGCTGVEKPGTVWFKPCIATSDTARFDLDPDNFYWDFTLRLAKEQLRVGHKKVMVAFPDLIEGLDTLAAMRGTRELLVDLLERPDWVHSALDQITERYFDCYDRLYDMFKDETGGSHFWAWAPGRMSKLQCDFSAMISPGMFGAFMRPVLNTMAQRLDYCMYHWDGPGAIPHHDHLLSVPGITMLQWTPGAGTEPTTDRRWWPLYHKTIEAGKKMFIGGGTPDQLKAMKKEFGDEFKHFLIRMHALTHRQAKDVINTVSD